MKLFSKRNLLVGISTLILGISTSAVIWGVPKFLKRNTSVKGQVTAFVLDDRGHVNGLLLTGNDQLHFSPETGVAVTAQIKVGDEITATGHAGAQSSYGREVRIEQISVNGRTITEIKAGPPHGPRDHHGPKERSELESRPAPPEGVPVQPTSGLAVDALSTSTPAPAAPEVFKATGSVQTHLVNGHGEVDGLILSSGEQVRFSPKVGQLIVAAEQSGNQISVEGTGVRTERGTVISPTTITVGTQTITLSR